MTTLQDIADRVGVTRIVVSRVLNNRLGKIGVSEEKRLRILEVARELGYVANRSARTLATRQNRALGLVVNQRRYETPTYTDGAAIFNLLSGMHLVCDPLDYRCLYACADMRNEVAFEMPKFLKERSVDGVIVHGYVHHSVEKQLLATGLPLGHVGFNVDPGSQMPCVSSDMEKAACDLLDQACQQGIRSVHLFIGSGPGSKRIVKSFLERGKALGKSMRVTAKTGGQVSPGYDEARQHGVELAASGRPPELLLCSIAQHHPLLVGMASGGWHCPRDVQLVAFSPEGYHEMRLLGTDLRITQIVLPFIAISRGITRQLIEVLEGKVSAVQSSLEACYFLEGETSPSLRSVDFPPATLHV